MYFTTTSIAALLLATLPSAIASPVLAPRATTWTIRSLKRPCNSADTSCTWTFGIDTGSAVTPCSFTVTGSPADQTDRTVGATCGAFTVTTGWSGQFGPGNGFTTLAVVNYATKQIAWPAYTDKQLAGGVVVSPDQSYAVTQL
ncbi:hypothetical protein BX600DRAFT_550018 [Xylariales sp. PMI_506]|nr:hypothetical protein BX600DRAFT_550018 [Xylariales sp. PMI_506]